MTPKDMLPLMGDDNEGQDAGKRVEKMAEVELRVSCRCRLYARYREAGLQNALVHKQKHIK